MEKSITMNLVKKEGEESPHYLAISNRSEEKKKKEKCKKRK
jgi:hypothetical protein